MAVNRDKPDRWKDDIARSVDMYNDWFMRFAPQAYRTTRVQTTKDVTATLEATKNMTAHRSEFAEGEPCRAADIAYVYLSPARRRQTDRTRRYFAEPG